MSEEHPAGARQTHDRLPAGGDDAHAPRWVRVFGIVGIAVAVAVVLILFAGQGQHGPGRHVPASDGPSVERPEQDRPGHGLDQGGPAAPEPHSRPSGARE